MEWICKRCGTQFETQHEEPPPKPIFEKVECPKCGSTDVTRKALRPGKKKQKRRRRSYSKSHQIQ